MNAVPRPLALSRQEDIAAPARGVPSRPYSRRDVIEAFEVMLGRSPEAETVIEAFVAESSQISGVYRALLGADEFFLRSSYPGLLHTITGADIALLRKYLKPDREPIDGYIVDFVGSKTDVRYVESLKPWSGAVEPIPRPSNFHSKTYEWSGSLRSVDEAKDRFTMMELGAGWGPWLVSCGLAARDKGIATIRLIGVEGDKGHCDFLRKHMADNGISPETYTLLHGVIAARSGSALFPVIDRPDTNFGAEPLFFSSEREARAFATKNGSVEDFHVMRAFTISEALRGEARLDLLHVDVQGSEADLLEANDQLLNSHVRRVVVGTHGRLIEERLHTLFSRLGWTCEADDPCRFAVGGGKPTLSMDGTQVWSNPALAR
jgi:FkbM family methyltransferase